MRGAPKFPAWHTHTHSTLHTRMLEARIMVYVLVLWAAALVIAVAAARQDSVAFASSSLRPRGGDLPRGRRRERAHTSTSVASTSMSLLRTFEANELQLQRFIGELGFVEITDWCVFCGGALPNLLQHVCMCAFKQTPTLSLLLCLSLRASVAADRVARQLLVFFLPPFLVCIEVALHCFCSAAGW